MSTESDIQELREALAALRQENTTLKARMAEMEDFAQTHIGMDWGQSGINQNSPHPNMSSDSIEIGGGVMALTQSGTVIHRENRQYNLEVIANQITGGAGAVPVGNSDMDYNNDGTIDILDASIIAASFYPPAKAGIVWVDRDHPITTKALAGSTPLPQGYIFGLASNAPNAYMTHSVVEQMGALSDGGHAYIAAHSAKTTALSQADLLLKGAVWQNAATLTQIAANTNNYEVGENLQCVVRISSDAARDITGIAAPTISTTVTPSAWWLILQNVGSFNITLKDNSGSSSAGNKFAFDADIVLKPDQCAFLIYDSVATVWRALSMPSTTLTTLLLTDTAWAAAGDLVYGTGNDTATILSGSSENAFYLRYLTASNAPIWAAWLQPTSESAGFNVVPGKFHECSGTITAMMPAASVPGRMARMINVGSGVVTVARAGSDTFFYGTSGLTSHTINPGECFTYTANTAGNAWLVS